MIQFNLLPNVKLEYVRAQRNKRLTILMAVLVAGVALAVMVTLFVGVQILQKKHSDDLSADIKSESRKLEAIPELSKILTIQNQLDSLPGLHDKKPATTRIFDYLKQITPNKVSIASVVFDFELQSVEISGSADAISSVNKFADTLKFTGFSSENQSDGTTLAFSEVVLVSFGRDDKGTSYQLSLKFDPLIFDNTSNISLLVPPNKITTRSETEKPDSLFQPLSDQGAVDGQ